MGVKADKALVFIQKNKKDLTSLEKGTLVVMHMKPLMQGSYERKICYGEAMVRIGVLWEGNISTEVSCNKGMITAKVKRMGH